MSPSPNRYHQEISRNIEVLLCNYCRAKSLGKVYNAPFDVYLTDRDVLQPDVLFVANKRAAILTEEGARGAPTLVIEILSESTAHLDRTTKKGIYAAAGVEEMWLVDPQMRRIEVYRLQEDPSRPRAVYSEGEQFASVCCPGLMIHCQEVFRS